jgi:regulator of sirC expression with transglutaminase-like and TPR domain
MSTVRSTYDHEDPYGRKSPNKLLHHYLATRCGQCVSMPILFVIIAERLGLKVALASAPEHVLVRFTDEADREHNLETTSGAHPSRDAWYRESFPITDRALQTGIYLRSLTKREGVALMASTVVEHLNRQARFHQIVKLAKVVLSQCPRDVAIMLWQGTGYGALLDQLRTKYANPWVMPPAIRAQAFAFMEGNRSAFAAAENLGWVEPQWER